MKIEQIDTFIEPMLNTFKQEAGIELKEQERHFESKLASSSLITVLVGISGRLQGVVTFSYTKDVASKIISKMTNREDIGDLDELGRDCLCELANIVVGNSTVQFYNAGVKCNSSPPTIIIGGENSTLCIQNVEKVTVIPFDSEFGIIHMNLAMLDIEEMLAS